MNSNADRINTIISTSLFILVNFIFMILFRNSEWIDLLVIRFGYGQVKNFIGVFNIAFGFVIFIISFFHLVRYDLWRLYVLPIIFLMITLLEINLFFSFNIWIFILQVALLCFGFLVDSLEMLHYSKVKYFLQGGLLGFVLLLILTAFKIQISLLVIISELEFVVLIGFAIYFIIIQEKKLNLTFSFVILLEMMYFHLAKLNFVLKNDILIFDFAKFAFFLFLFIYFFVDNFKINLRYLSERESQIKLYAERINTIIDKKTKKIRTVNNQINKELEYSKEIQQSILPDKKLYFQDVNFVSDYFPCEKLSGDFYDIFRIDSKNFGMYILDVSGHGVSAALLTMFCNHIVKSDERLVRRYRGLRPHKNLEHFYQEFNQTNFPDETHMVLFFASYNTETHVLKYASAGINAWPIILKKNGIIKELTGDRGIPISKLGEFIQPEFKTESIILEKGDRILFYTDGLTDKRKNNVFDEEELKEFLMDHYDLELEELREKINTTIFDKSNILHDDITYFIMSVEN